ncbi:hypothetical protein D3C85_1645790 [compost metagenome]
MLEVSQWQGESFNPTIITFSSLAATTGYLWEQSGIIHALVKDNSSLSSTLGTEQAHTTNQTSLVIKVVNFGSPIYKLEAIAITTSSCHYLLFLTRIDLVVRLL